MGYDLIIRNGTVVDGTGYPRRVADVAVTGGIIQKIGRLEGAEAAKEIDATGLIVAPGVIDIHTHFDAQLNWDPYCTSSSWHGTTTVGMGNCGFGYAPVHVADRDRVMMMMVNSEQVPFVTQKAGIQWQWETFPEWMDHLRRLPKGINTAMLFPMNAMLVYVMGAEAGRRPATEAERARMRQMLHEAMDAGAVGFSFSQLGNGNGHVDHDGGPVPTDLMEAEEAYNLARVLRERGEGVIQSNVELRQECRREISETVARISGRPVIHNAIMVMTEPQGAARTEASLALANRWRETIAWVELCEAEGLNIFLQSVSLRGFFELKIDDSTLFVRIPVLEDFQLARGAEAKTRLLLDPDYRQRARDAYDPKYFVPLGGGPDRYFLSSAPGSERFAKYVGRRLGEIADAEGLSHIDTLFEVLLDTKMEADFLVTESGSRDADQVSEMVRHRRVIPGTSDAGAHVKMFAFGYWSTDLVMWLVRETGKLTLEEAHQMLSYRPARAFELKGRGAVLEGYAADLIVYDYEALGYQQRYVTVHDLPGGEWRRTIPAEGMRHVLVNGAVIVRDNETTGALPGELLSNHDLPAREPSQIAAE